MRLLRGWACAGVCFVVASCGFPRPAHIPDDGAAPTGDDAAPSATYQLVSIEPALATTGDTLTLEGTFAATATVHFPGGAAQAAVVLGDHRATVVVPPEATAGDLTVTTGGDTVGPMPFRRTSFVLGLQPFRATYEQADSGRQTPNFVVSRQGHTSTVIANSLYIVGGNSEGVQSSVERALINADGTLGAFALVPDVALVLPRAGHASIRVGPWLYVIGGSGASGALSSVERAKINADGSLGQFAIVPDVALAIARSSHTIAVIGNSLYVVGGTSGSGSDVADVEKAAINVDGSLSRFAAVAGAMLHTARHGHTCEVAGTALYVIGGLSDAGDRLRSIEQADIRADGSIGTFVAVPGAGLTVSRSGHASIVLGRAVYVIGGSGDSGVLSSVERATVNDDGTLGSFMTVSGVTLVGQRNGFTASLVGDFLYALGGSVVGGMGNANLGNVQRSSINAHGAVSSFAISQTATISNGRGSSASVVIGNFLYMIGGTIVDGTQDVSTIERAAIAPDGSLGPYTILSDTKLATARALHACAIVGNSLYVFGGSDGHDKLSSIERAIVNRDGTLGTFSVVSDRALVTARIGHKVVIVGSNLYVLGGKDASADDLTNVESSAIGPDGSLGVLAIEPGVALTTGRYGLSSVVNGDYLYAIAGLANSAGIGGSVERAPVNTSDGRLGQFTSVTNTRLSINRFFQSASVVGNFLYILGGSGTLAMPASASVERATMSTDSSLGPFAPVPAVSLAIDRVGQTSVVASNHLYVIGGTLDALSSIEQANLQ